VIDLENELFFVRVTPWSHWSWKQLQCQHTFDFPALLHGHSPPGEQIHKVQNPFLPTHVDGLTLVNPIDSSTEWHHMSIKGHQYLTCELCDHSELVLIEGCHLSWSQR
jgi:hypothetical protein